VQSLGRSLRMSSLLSTTVQGASRGIVSRWRSSSRAIAGPTWRHSSEPAMVLPISSASPFHLSSHLGSRSHLWSWSWSRSCWCLHLCLHSHSCLHSCSHLHFVFAFTFAFVFCIWVFLCIQVRFYLLW